MTSYRGPALAARPDLEELVPYAAPQLPARYRLNTNESPYPPPEGLVAEVAAELGKAALNRYPARDAGQTLDRLSEHVGRNPEELWMANGSNEVFLHLLLAFGGAGRRVLVFEPTYSMHSMVARISGASVVAARRTEDFAIDLDEAVATVHSERPDMVILCSPNNPSGNCDPLDLVRTLLEVVGGIVVVDEAYGEFAQPQDSAAPLFSEHDNLVVVKTFSKAWRLAGVRIGYMMADPALISQVSKVALPYHLSTITQLFAEAALRYAATTAETIKAITIERDRVSIELQAMGVKTFPSSANFVLFQVEDARRVWEGLLRRDVLIRNYAGHQGLEGCLRVTAGMENENESFISALEETLSDH